MTLGNISAFNRFIIPSVQNANLQQSKSSPLSPYSKSSPAHTTVRLSELENRAEKDAKHKKLAVGFAAAVGIAAVVAGGILVVNRIRQNRLYAVPVCEQVQNVFNKSEQAQKLAPKIQEEAAQTLLKAQETLEDAKKVFQKGTIVEDGISIVQIEESIMKEFDKDGKKLLRWTSFNNGIPTKVREYSSDTNVYNAIFANEDGNIFSILAGCENKPDRCEIAKEYLFDCAGNLKKYLEAAVNRPEATKDAKLRVDFESQKLISYVENYHERPSFRRSNFRIDFEENGFIKAFTNLLHEYTDGSYKAVSQMLYKNGDPVYYDTGCVKSAKGCRTFVKRIDIELKD